MQIAGATCSVCQRLIIFESDGTWCPGCEAVFHERCLAQATAVCPSCRQPWFDPRSAQVYSHSCPSCGRSNSPKSSVCLACGTRMIWASAKVLSSEQRQIRNLGQRKFVLGIFEIAAAVAPLAVAAVLPLKGAWWFAHLVWACVIPLVILIVSLFAIAVLLFLRGSKTLTQARAMLQFE